MRMKHGVKGQGALKLSLQNGRRNLPLRKLCGPVFIGR